jgi:plasmid stabilization system protein ParE
VTVLFSEGAAEVFDELPTYAQHRIERSIELISTFPRIYPRRRRGMMRGYRYFVAGRFLVYYSIAGSEVRVAAIIPAAMRKA